VQEVPAPAHKLFAKFPALEAWCLAGTLSANTTVSANLRLHVVRQVTKQAWGEHTVTILLALLRTRQVGVDEGVRADVAAMHVIRSYSEESRQQLRTALAEHAPHASLRVGIASPTSSQASVLVDMGDALNVMLEEIEKILYGE
jgi:hypothetical protein